MRHLLEEANLNLAAEMRIAEYFVNVKYFVTQSNITNFAQWLSSKFQANDLAGGPVPLSLNRGAVERRSFFLRTRPWFVVGGCARMPR